MFTMGQRVVLLKEKKTLHLWFCATTVRVAWCSTSASCRLGECSVQTGASWTFSPKMEELLPQVYWTLSCGEASSVPFLCWVSPWPQGSHSTLTTFWSTFAASRCLSWFGILGKVSGVFPGLWGLEEMPSVGKVFSRLFPLTFTKGCFLIRRW